MGRQIVEIEMAFALRRAALAEAQQLAKPAIGSQIARIGEDIRRAVGEHEPDADDEAKPVAARVAIIRVAPGAVRADDAGKGVAVGDADGLQPQRVGLQDQLVSMRPAFQKGEVRHSGEFGIGAHHANNPCRNQRGCGRSAA
jgi:hypothetical protein